MALLPREREILALVVEGCAAQATPVGSRDVARRSSLGLSPATVRSVMADLKERGFLEQPHTSAGSLPTAQGLRHYLDFSLPQSAPGRTEQELITGTLGQAGLEIEDILRQASRILASISRQASMVLAPSRDPARWKQIDFVSVGPGMVMALLVLQGGLVQKRLIRCEEDYSSDDLTAFGNYLNHLFADLTVEKAQAHILRELKEAGDALSTLSLLSFRALALARDLMAEEDEREMFVEGASSLVGRPEFTDLEHMRGLLTFLEERGRLLSLLTRTMRERGITITLGREANLEPVQDCGLVSSTYAVKGQPAGVVGVIGPMRMDYAYVVPVVDFTARVLTSMFSGRF
jgi:heat-inducible transcriptional repressor